MEFFCDETYKSRKYQLDRNICWQSFKSLSFLFGAVFSPSVGIRVVLKTLCSSTAAFLHLIYIIIIVFSFLFFCVHLQLIYFGASTSQRFGWVVLENWWMEHKLWFIYFILCICVVMLAFRPHSHIHRLGDYFNKWNGIGRPNAIRYRLAQNCHRLSLLSLQPANM